MKTTISIIIMLAVLAMGATALAHHQQAGGVDIVHSAGPQKNLSYDGSMTVFEVHDLLTNAATGEIEILDVRSPWERNGSIGGCLTRVALGMSDDPYNAGIPIWQHNEQCAEDIESPEIPVHVQGPIGIVFNAQTSDGTDLVGWPFRAAGFMIINPDFDNYIDALETEGVMDKSKAVIVMCAMGYRAKYMADYLKTELGYEKVYVMEGGLSAWNQAGLPTSTNEADWIAWDQTKIYDPARLTPYGGAKWPNSQFLTGGDPVIPEWLGQYVPPSSMVGYPDPSCTAPGNLVGLNGPWPKDKRIEDLNITPVLTSITMPAGWGGPTLNSQCIQTMMGFHGMDYPTAEAACAGAPPVVPGYFDAWPIEPGKFIEGASLPVRAEDDPCGDMYTDYFGDVWYPPQSACEVKSVENQMRDCIPGDPLCVGERTYCWAMPPFGSGFAPVTVPDGKFWTPDLPWKVQMNFATP